MTYLGSYQSEAIPLWASVAIRIGWLRRRYAWHNVSTLDVYQEGITMRSRCGQDRTLQLAEIRRIWFEEFQSGSEQDGNLSFRIDIIDQNLDVLFSLKRADVSRHDPVYQLMKGLYDRWHMATWKHYQVVAAIVEHPTDPGRYLCMQKPDTRYSYTSRHWEFPGGKVETGETEPEALQRELREEMAYEVTVRSQLTTIEHSYPDFGITLSCWLCSTTTTDFTRREHLDHRWLTPTEMKQLEWCAADAPVLEELAKLCERVNV